MAARPWKFESSPGHHKGDIPASIDFGDSVAVDTETMGLKPVRDRLCLIQLSAGDNTAHLVQLSRDFGEAPNLTSLLADPTVTKIFHFARFDIAMLAAYLDVFTTPVYCTKIASRLVRTYTDRHGLRDLCRELLGIDLSKQEQSSDWGAPTLTRQQREYAASDVLHLHRLRDVLNARLEREGRRSLAQSCFDFLPIRAHLDLIGYDGEDIFSH